MKPIDDQLAEARRTAESAARRVKRLEARADVERKHGATFRRMKTGYLEALHSMIGTILDERRPKVVRPIDDARPTMHFDVPESCICGGSQAEPCLYCLREVSRVTG